MSGREPNAGKPDSIEPVEIAPIEIDPVGESKLAEWIGFAVLLLAIAGVMVLLLVWLTGSILMAVAVAIGMIGLMVFMGFLASSSLGRG